MSEHNHPIAAGIFVLGAASLIGLGAYSGVQASLAAPAHEGGGHGGGHGSGGGHGGGAHEGGGGRHHGGGGGGGHGGGGGGGQHGEMEPDEDDPAGGDRPMSVEEQVMAAVRMGQGGDYASAATVLTYIVQQHPNDTGALYNLGVALVALDQLDEADRVFERVNQLAPEDYDALAERASIRFQKGESEKAIAMLETIPVGKGRLAKRFTEDERWRARAEDPRMAALFKKHGVELPAQAPQQP